MRKVRRSQVEKKRNNFFAVFIPSKISPCQALTIMREAFTAVTQIHYFDYVTLSTYSKAASFLACLDRKVQVTQIFEIFYYLYNLLLFISNHRAESNIRRNYISNGCFINLKSPRLMHPRFQTSERAKFHDVTLRTQE